MKRHFHFLYMAKCAPYGNNTVYEQYGNHVETTWKPHCICNVFPMWKPHGFHIDFAAWKQRCKFATLFPYGFNIVSIWFQHCFHIAKFQYEIHVVSTLKQCCKATTLFPYCSFSYCNHIAYAVWFPYGAHLPVYMREVASSCKKHRRQHRSIDSPHQDGIPH